MAKFILRKKKFDYKHILAILITISFLCLSIFVYTNIFWRTLETGKDIGTSFWYYLDVLLNGDSTFEPSVLNESSIDFTVVFPMSFEEFKEYFKLWFKALFDRSNFLDFLSYNSFVNLLIVLFIELIFIVVIIIKMLFNRMLTNENNDYNVESKNLKRFKKIERKVNFIYIKIKNFFEFCLSKKYYKILWIVIWLYNLNIFNICGEIIAYFTYLISSINFSSFFFQIYKLVFDLGLMFSALPFPIWIILTIAIIVKIRNRIAYKRLEHMESKNTGFVHSLGAVTVFFGLCGGGKGLVMTDMCQTMQKCYRYDTKDTMQKFDLMFPHFPWILFENHLMTRFRNHTLYSLATIEQYVSNLKKYYTNAINLNLLKSAKRFIFDYDTKIYNFDYDNKLYIIDIFEAMDTYAKAYYIYTLPELTLSNYAIRSDGIMLDKGNFPLWDYDYFHRDSRELEKISKYGKILDFDVLRKGKKVDENNPLADSLEVGIVVITEIDKDRGNQNDTKELKSSVDVANQKNDKFNLSLKLDRHSSTIDYKYYLKFMFDLQRTMKTEADIRESGDNLGIGKKESNLLSMPLFFIEEFLYGLIFGRFISTYEDFRFYRGDNNLFMYLLKKVCGKFINYYGKTYNKFGYEIHHLKYIKDGNPDGIADEQIYYIMNSKAKAKRYMTDSFVDYFRGSALECSQGFNDYRSYQSVKATREEMDSQHSYFIDDLEKNVVKHKKEKE